MRGRNGQFVRMIFVLMLGVGLGALAGAAARPDRHREARLDKPSPIILATVLESSVPDHCLLSPREEDDHTISGDKAQEQAKGARARKKIIACG
jgi:hypothetical protein